MIYNWQRLTDAQKREILKELSAEFVINLRRFIKELEPMKAKVYVIELQPEYIKIID